MPRDHPEINTAVAHDGDPTTRDPALQVVHVLVTQVAVLGRETPQPPSGRWIVDAKTKGPHETSSRPRLVVKAVCVFIVEAPKE